MGMQGHEDEGPIQGARNSNLRLGGVGLSLEAWGLGFCRVQDFNVWSVGFRTSGFRVQHLWDFEI